jgi:serine/threonine-protein kinase RsbT
LDLQVQSTEAVHVRTTEDVLNARQCVRRMAVGQGFSLVDQTKIVTAASELARNLVLYGGGGVMTAEIVRNGVKSGIRVRFEDEGPGIADVQQALKDGFTTGHGLGLGLGGAKRLSHEFQIESAVGKGTCVTILRWKA